MDISDTTGMTPAKTSYRRTKAALSEAERIFDQIKQIHFNINPLSASMNLEHADPDVDAVEIAKVQSRITRFIDIIERRTQAHQLLTRVRILSRDAETKVIESINIQGNPTPLTEDQLASFDLQAPDDLDEAPDIRLAKINLGAYKIANMAELNVVTMRIKLTEIKERASVLPSIVAGGKRRTLQRKSRDKSKRKTRRKLRSNYV
jgi:hypothetical protein